MRWGLMVQISCSISAVVQAEFSISWSNSPGHWPLVKDLGTITEFSPSVKQTIIEGVTKVANGRSIQELERERDSMLLELLATRQRVKRRRRQLSPVVTGTNLDP